MKVIESSSSGMNGSLVIFLRHVLMVLIFTIIVPEVRLAHARSLMMTSQTTFFYCFPAAEANSTDGPQPHAATPHPVQPKPTHAQLRWLLSFRTGSARLPQLSNTHAGEKEPITGTFSLHCRESTGMDNKIGDGWKQFSYFSFRVLVCWLRHLDRKWLSTPVFFNTRANPLFQWFSSETRWAAPDQMCSCCTAVSPSAQSAWPERILCICTDTSRHIIQFKHSSSPQYEFELLSWYLTSHYSSTLVYHFCKTPLCSHMTSQATYLSPKTGLFRQNIMSS